MSLQSTESVGFSAELGASPAAAAALASATSPAPAAAAAVGAPVASSMPHQHNPSMHEELLMLSGLDAISGGVIEALGKAYIRLVRSSWILSQPKGYRIERRQKLEEPPTATQRSTLRQ
jgi:hypothetical protein